MKNLLRLKVIADENIDNRIIKGLRNKGFNIMSILEDYRGISDKEVIELARNKNAIVLTEDKDFGNWVFAHKEAFACFCAEHGLACVPTIGLAETGKGYSAFLAVAGHEGWRYKCRRRRPNLIAYEYQFRGTRKNHNWVDTLRLIHPTHSKSV